MFRLIDKLTVHVYLFQYYHTPLFPFPPSFVHLLVYYLFYFYR